MVSEEDQHTAAINETREPVQEDNDTSTLSPNRESYLKEILSRIQIGSEFLNGLKVLKVTSVRTLRFQIKYYLFFTEELIYFFSNLKNGDMRFRTLRLSRNKMILYLTPKSHGDEDAAPIPLFSLKGISGLTGQDQANSRAIHVGSIMHIQRGFVGSRKFELSW